VARDTLALFVLLIELALLDAALDFSTTQVKDLRPFIDKRAPKPLFCFLIIFVFSDSGLTMLCSLRNKPQALQRGWPPRLRRHSGVVCVKQFVQVVKMPIFIPTAPTRFVDELLLLKLPGRLKTTKPNPLTALEISGGELGVKCTE
jgi:hypothetical protein